MINVWLKIETKMEMNEYSLSCVMCLSWNLLFLTPCPRLICLEQSSLRICTKEQSVITKQEASEYIHYVHKIQRLWNVCPSKL